MPTTTSLEFQRKFGQYLNESHREPVEITRHGRREFVLMSAAQYDELLSAAQRSGKAVETASDPEQN
ncbi:MULTISPECIES: type II toxin-antitoxin system prevent-host-death family antitoxin [Alphaproteobacteria]|jgi:prevent-host-death family protein|uniref:type II toxin-antitoxin system prevent-host-death family antitoxin n=1 Tax=Alphaproteobacteria TaxID=28211 RepID=UPI00214BAB8B|nr:MULTISPECIES: type II toxin-antitoxin system prevent-host-death family antitoxin [Alphaproteobacteria]MCW2247772.1 prevent-host-death family protein [Azospirillum fermentarium]